MGVYLVDEKGLTLHLLVTPKASRMAWGKVVGERMQLKVTVPPVDGKANQACVQFLSKAFRCPKSRIQLLKGETCREKTFLLTRFDPASLTAWKQTHHIK